MEPIYIILLCVVAFVAVLHVLSSRRTPKLRTINVRSQETKLAGAVFMRLPRWG